MNFFKVVVPTRNPAIWKSCMLSPKQGALAYRIGRRTIPHQGPILAFSSLGGAINFYNICIPYGVILTGNGVQFEKNFHPKFYNINKITKELLRSWWSDNYRIAEDEDYWPLGTIFLSEFTPKEIYEPRLF